MKAEAARDLPHLTHCASTPKFPHRGPRYRNEAPAGRWTVRAYSLTNWRWQPDSKCNSGMDRYYCSEERPFNLNFVVRNRLSNTKYLLSFFGPVKRLLDLLLDLVYAVYAEVYLGCTCFVRRLNTILLWLFQRRGQARALRFAWRRSVCLLLNRF